MIEQARTNLGLMYTERGRRERIAKGRKQSAPPVDAILEVFGTEPGVSASEQIMETLRQAGFEVEEIPEAELCDEDRRAIEAKKRDLAAKGHDPESVHSGAFRYRMAQDCTAPGCKLHNPNGREAPRG